MKITALFRSSRLFTGRRRKRLFHLPVRVGGRSAVVAAPALAGDVYSNIGPAPQLPAGGLVGRYPLRVTPWISRSPRWASG